jgi:hypothetical protein
MRTRRFPYQRKEGFVPSQRSEPVALGAVLPGAIAEVARTERRPYDRRPFWGEGWVIGWLVEEGLPKDEALGVYAGLRGRCSCSAACAVVAAWNRYLALPRRNRVGACIAAGRAPERWSYSDELARRCGRARDARKV